MVRSCPARPLLEGLWVWMHSRQKGKQACKDVGTRSALCLVGSVVMVGLLAVSHGAAPRFTWLCLQGALPLLNSLLCSTSLLSCCALQPISADVAAAATGQVPAQPVGAQSMAQLAAASGEDLIGCISSHSWAPCCTAWLLRKFIVGLRWFDPDH